MNEQMTEKEFVPFGAEVYVSLPILPLAAVERPTLVKDVTVLCVSDQTEIVPASVETIGDRLPTIADELLR